MLCLSPFSPPGPEEERAEQHVGPFPPAPPSSSSRRGRRRLPLAGRSHARAGILPHPQTGETHQEETLKGAEGKELSGLEAAELIRLVIYGVLCTVTPSPCDLVTVVFLPPRKDLSKVLALSLAGVKIRTLPAPRGGGNKRHLEGSSYRNDLGGFGHCLAVILLVWQLLAWLSSCCSTEGFCLSSVLLLTPCCRALPLIHYLLWGGGNQPQTITATTKTPTLLTAGIWHLQLP